ncbi:MAG: hypothetical protein NTY01_07390 [Verrucomicrobia bacterium]|nr:hypothetical protein [Verrucomicrobiota bacterium]
MNGNDEAIKQWLPVVGRALAFICLAQADMRDKDLGSQGKFLESLGLSREEAAAMLGTSYASLNQLIFLTKKKKGGKRGTKKSKG